VLELERVISELQSDDSFSDHNPNSLKLADLTTLHSQTAAAISDLSSRATTNNNNNNDKTDGIIPTLPALQATIAKVKAETLPASVDNTFDRIAASFHTAYSGRRLFRTAGNSLGLGAQSLQAGDVVWVVAGAAVPTVLRPVSGKRWRLVGEAYIHGIMDGEVVRMSMDGGDGGRGAQKIELV
jgi:hypothetical protein